MNAYGWRVLGLWGPCSGALAQLCRVCTAQEFVWSLVTAAAQSFSHPCMSPWPPAAMAIAKWCQVFWRYGGKSPLSSGLAAHRADSLSPLTHHILPESLLCAGAAVKRAGPSKCRRGAPCSNKMNFQIVTGKHETKDGPFRAPAQTGARVVLCQEPLVTGWVCRSFL